MSNRIVAVTVLAAALGATVSPSWSDSGAFVGQWHWNRSASTVAPDEPLPRDVVLKIGAADASRIQWTLTTVDSQGEQHVESYSGAGDRKPVAIAGGPEGTTGVFTLAGDTLEGSYANQDGSSDRSSCTVSADRKKMTCHGTESDGKGHSMDYVDVYDRQ